MENHVWQALPQRKRKLDKNAAGIPTICAVNEDLFTAGPDVQHQQKIVDNVAARSCLKRANATLESRDGCAGEFYEYLDHTADVQCHCWGSDLSDAFSNMAPCIFNYMTDLSTVVIDPEKSLELTVTGHDIQSLLFAYMDELLFHFSTDGYCCVKAEILSFNRENFEITFLAHGDTFDQTIHPQGTEIKAITYSNMQIHETPDRVDLYVIVDI